MDKEIRDNYKRIRELSDKDRKEIFEFAMKRSKEILLGIDNDQYSDHKEA